MSLESYFEAVARKRVSFEPRGFEPSSLHPSLKPHQAHCVDFAVRAGCAALFLDTGLGKTLCALDWARLVTERTNKPVLMLAPLAVSHQHQRGEDAEKHLCPMPLNITERGVQMWSNPGDTVLSPFMGVGSEGHVALKTGRRFIGFELNPPYFNEAVKNLAAAETLSASGSLLSLMEAGA